MDESLDSSTGRSNLKEEIVTNTTYKYQKENIHILESNNFDTKYRKHKHK